LGLTFSGDLAQGVQFPNFGPAAAEMGAHSVLAVGLFPDGEKDRFGALNIYSYQAGGLNELDRDLALILAAHASTALAGTLAATSAELETAQLRQALQSRDVIGRPRASSWNAVASPPTRRSTCCAGPPSRSTSSSRPWRRRS
jgi:hypothetical protein